MGKVDTITKKYMGNPIVFADAFNQFLYRGDQKIDPARLMELDTTEIVVPYGADGAGVPEQKYRDVPKLLYAMTDGRTAYCVVGIENQLCKAFQISKERTGGGLNKGAIFSAPLFSTLSVFPN